ncbi:SixA phosphatase family protein [Aliarcobacter thereius]|uniref:Histidine phosphatase superfamily (Branch 1) n=2 Tax=Aliarcobacter thereius TaxID=544718 RepID=A0A1C0B790_9BACT|nr:histidine phosphatase family protein [Aliarcobacter thereius]OCL91075.1 Histidine phosphatase superfamily (branch 1) [Aliarcobacter thereius]OCL96071.1 Histidine phosphatase superfamily (branch 1) [Aliarcobacter thereius LMG 24486]OCL99402.1 Histidine phosphatase superfamily (branch 1) [Aliarcobacter thereius]QBF15957.1 phosphohistidine phosphatase [Aliarcobacter thereius LMG 24486]TLS94698.1 histidine phosphatase family protein [Aliarcobacter thereius]
MREIILIRHAKSSWKDISLDDFSRPLNKRGEKDAPFMAKKLKSLIQTPDLIISSPSLRTKLTLKSFLDEFKYKKDVVFEKNIYEAPLENLLDVLKNIENKHNTIFFIGHNPGFNLLADYLLGGFTENIPTSGILKMSLDINSWSELKEDCASLEFFIYPKMF